MLHYRDNHSLVDTRAKLARLSIIQVLLLIAALLVALFAASPSLAGAAENDNKVIVQIKSGVTPSIVNYRYGTTVVNQLPGTNTYLVMPSVGQTADSIVARMQGDPLLVYAEANYKASQMQTLQSSMYYDPASALSTGGGTPASLDKAYKQWAFTQIRLKEAHSRSKGWGITVAVVDSGVWTGHPDLAARMLPGRNITNGSNDVTDETGHGTFVAGIIAQVAPEAKILPVKVLDSSGLGDVKHAAEGIRWAADNGAQIINISLGTYYQHHELDEAVRHARDARGALVLASAGNNNTSNQRFPASYEKTFSVAATDPGNRKASFSNYNKDTIRVTAPGVTIYSTYYKGGFAYGDGTSFSTPQVAGLAALLWATKPDWKYDNVKGQIESTASELDYCDPVYGVMLGKGIIDASYALGGPRKDKDYSKFTCQR